MDTIYEDERETMVENEEQIESEKYINIVLTCPNCNEYVLIEKLNCKIFRHGVFKRTCRQINPHSTKTQCDLYVEKQLIYGCGKPFFIIIKNNIFFIEICDYI